MIFYRLIIDISKTRVKNGDKEYIFESERPYMRLSEMFKLLVDKKDTYSKDLSRIILPGELIGSQLTVGCAVDPLKSSLFECVKLLKKELGLIKIIEFEEICSSSFRKICNFCDHKYLFMISDLESTLNLDIDQRGSMFARDEGFRLSEKVFTDKIKTKKECLIKVKEILPSKSFIEEINRIYSKENMKRFYGHPVHYLISARDMGAAQDIIDILVTSLIGTKRLLSSRVISLTDLKSESCRSSEFDKVFDLAKNGTVVVSLDIEQKEGIFSTSNDLMRRVIQEKLEKYGESTLFIFVDVSGKTSVKDEDIALLQTGTDVIQICEGSGNRKEAKDYLVRLIDKSKYKGCDSSTIDQYIPEGDYFTVSDIYKIYHEWYDRGLRNIIYKAYKDDVIKPLTIEQYTNEPYKDLQELIGLNSIKNVIDDIIATAKLNRIREGMNLKNKCASMHMVFTGNPGTAKTTVARLIGHILKNEEVLSSGHMVECGRQDLVGKYVGWTARIVEEKFKAARGGVLFIDEAYSLVDRSNSYGAEAINTIVQLMENYRSDVIVILAGYPDKMKEFMDQNEGLNSRVAFYLDFPDYDKDELLGIMDLMVKQYGYKLSKAAREKAGTILKSACDYKNFGNGRYVRNMLEQATMHQARRLMKQEKETITKKEAMLILPEDISEVSLPEIKKEDNRTIGFIGER